MSTQSSEQDPLEYLKSMWGSMGFALPGLVTPTLDVGELEKRIADLKAVEGWLKMNLGMLQMTIQGLEMQRATLAAMASFGQAPASGEGEPKANPFTNPAMWPWNYMAGTPAEEGTAGTAATAEAKPAGKDTGKKPGKGTA